MNAPIITDEAARLEAIQAPPPAIQLPTTVTVQAPASSTPKWFRSLFLNLLKLKCLSFHQVFWILAAATLAFLGVMLSRSNVQATRIATPASQEFKDLQLAQSIQIVLGKPIKLPNGELVPVTDPKLRLQAGQMVKAWQDGELIKKQAGITVLAMLKGTTTPKHPCYQRSRQTCLEIVRRSNDQERVKANEEENFKELMRTSQVEEALDLIAQGDFEPGRYDTDLYTLAVATIRSARADLKAQSSGGQAKAIINSIVQGNNNDN